jgi:hypothetical protein
MKRISNQAIDIKAHAVMGHAIELFNKTFTGEYPGEHKRKQWLKYLATVRMVIDSELEAQCDGYDYETLVNDFQLVKEIG